jgi:hypothetical protein
MATPNASISEIIATTIQNRSKKLADNVTTNTALLYKLKEKGRVRPFSGGSSILEELTFAENGTFGWYNGYETLNISPSEVISAAEYAMKQCVVAVSISGTERLQNSGPEALIDLLEARIQNAEQTMINNISVGCYSDGTGNGGKQIGGLQALIADTPTSGTVGGINRATYNWWRNVSYDATTDGGAAATTLNIQSYMNNVWVQLVRGTDRPDLIVADNNYYKLYLGSLQSIQRIASDKMAQAGFTSLKFMDADVVLDGGYGGDAPANHMYFINTDYLSFRPHKDRNMVVIGGDRQSVNQDATVRLLGWAGNLTLRCAFLQGVLKD